MNGPAPRVFVVDDDDSVRRAMGRLIRSAGYEVDLFGSASEFLDNASLAACPACLVLDVQLPDLSGLELQRKLNARLPIIFITGHGDIEMTVGAMKAGATDFFPKPVNGADLLRAVAQALDGAIRTQETRTELDAIRANLDRLTPREREVMVLVVRGLMNKQVASELGIAEKTIKTHRARVMEKMDVTSLAGLVHAADKLGLSAPIDRASHC
ncbi:LuxR family two component transcriptional regulator [Paraburkholderia sp. BL23I1N1]|uniref:response regulator transcription factor n=1 Tax=Paraburkholderia sp. BL23I1N1 TaxID=1938802 RepID=UPI000E76E2F9|nr:response regulator [Paraburkholderia sp. BL23I1N1]RKE39466.1 LuxR family two component transcriptional regulator [Paraburkholderia sp. BL23I1N1]